MSNITGILSEDQSTIFVINVSDGRNLTDYQNNLLIPKADNFLYCLRFMVQNYLFGGATSEKSINEWLMGYEETFFHEISQGNFYQGNDKDLINKINPVFNLNTQQVADAELRMDTGALNLDRIARIRQINQRPYLNIKQKIFNGTGYVEA